MTTTFQPVELNDIHIVDVGKHLTEKPQIRELGVTLGLKAREVDGILENNKDNINEEAYKVLQKWFQGQPNRITAYVNLHRALHAVKLSLIANAVFQNKCADTTGNGYVINAHAYQTNYCIIL